MSDADNPPRKRFRRRAVRIGVLLASFLCWWNWPRGDQRLVGQWGVSDELEPDRVLSTLVLKRNGGGSWMFEEGPCLFNWRVSGNSLDLGPRTPMMFRPALRVVQKIVYDVTNRYYFVELDDYELVSVAPDEIVIRSNSVMNARRQILRRFEN